MEVKVNSDEWKGLSKEDRDKIQAIIASHFRDVKIAPDTKSKPALEALSQPPPLASISASRCTAACESRAAACRLRVAIRRPLTPPCLANGRSKCMGSARWHAVADDRGSRLRADPARAPAMAHSNGR